MTTGGFDPNVYGNPDVPGVPGVPGQPGGYPPPPNPYGQQGYPPPPNPYGNPGGYPAPPPGWGQPMAGRPGTLGVRFGARVIDGIIVGIVATVLSFVLGVNNSIMVTGLFSGLLMFAYFVAMEVTQSRTVGKMLLGLSVRGPGGTPKPDLKQSAIRNAFTLLPIVPYVGGLLAVIAYLVIAVTINSSPTKQGKHDELAGGTQVIKN
jgi:hypothetical protein